MKMVLRMFKSCKQLFMHNNCKHKISSLIVSLSDLSNANQTAFQNQLLQNLIANGGQNQDLNDLRNLQNLNNIPNDSTGDKRKLIGSGLLTGGVAALGVAGAAMATRSGQSSDIKKLKHQVQRKLLDNMMRKKRYERGMTNLTEKVNNLEDTLADLGESLSSMLSDLDVWTQGHVNMLAS